MITNNAYYKNELYIPNAKPSVTSDVTSVSAELDDFVEKYERQCLIKCLGLQLYLLFEAELDSSKATGLKDGSDAKWNDLLNGKTYTNPSGDLVQWRGVRFKTNSASTVYSNSFLANYVYYHYEQNYDVFRSGVGHVKPKGGNSEERSPAQKVIIAWREMVDMIQGKQFKKDIVVNRFGYGVDYYHENKEVTLYKFIEDMNNLVADTYLSFKPGYFEVHKNQFGI
jgi:hypothetical protein